MLQCTITFAVVSAAKWGESHVSEPSAVGEGQSAESGARGNHKSDPGRPVVSTTALRRALYALGADTERFTAAEVAQLAFDGRANAHTVKAWISGKRYVAPWAIELLQHKFASGAAAANERPHGPGRAAGLRVNCLALVRDERRA